MANGVAAALRVQGVVDVFYAQIVGRRCLQIDVDHENAGRYGVAVSDISDAIEVAMGGKLSMKTLESPHRFPVRASSLGLRTH